MILYIIIVLLLIYFISFKSNLKENFYHYYLPSNCVEDAFGDIKCYPVWNLRYYNQWVSD